MITSPTASAAAERFAAAVDRVSDAVTGDEGSAGWTTELGIVGMLRTSGARLAHTARGSEERVRERLVAALLAERSGEPHVDIRARQTTRETSLEVGVLVAADTVGGR